MPGLLGRHYSVTKRKFCYLKVRPNLRILPLRLACGVISEEGASRAKAMKNRLGRRETNEQVLRDGAETK
jgi:hypothetical protein